MPDYQHYIEEFLALIGQLVASESRRPSQWIIGISGAVLGATLAYGFGWLQSKQAEKRTEERDLRFLAEALYQEIADNFEAIIYLIGRLTPEARDFNWLQARLDGEVTFLAYEDAGKRSGLFYRIAEHGWLVGCYRELRRLCREGPKADEKRLTELLTNAWNIIRLGDPNLPSTKDKLRSKVSEQYRAEIPQR